MNHHLAFETAIGASLFASMAAAFIAVFGALWGARRAGMRAPESKSAPFISGALLAAMAGPLLYQGLSNRFPPDFMAAGLLLGGSVAVFMWGLRRLRV